MAKMIISENRLQELIQESIYEILEEGQYDESFGHWLGNKFQTARNKVRNFVNDFKAGQNDAREQNKDYNPYSIYGDREDVVRRMGNGAYSNYRYDLETRRNQKARGEIQNSTQDVQQMQNNNGVQPHPALAQNTQNSQNKNKRRKKKKNNGQQQGGQQRPVQPQGGQQRPVQPQGGQQRPVQPQGGQQRPVQPQGGQQRPVQPQGGQQQPVQPQGGQRRPAKPQGGQHRPAKP